MCGIAAILEIQGASPDRTALKRMNDSLFHRGPDDEGLYMEGAVGFGFRRLAILDLSPGSHQPMVSDDQSLVIVFNGEIYNYVELRSELQTLGHSFKTSGDTEVLLHAYQQWGSDCLPRLNGMWAFLIYDRRRGVIFGSRDRFGVKPLYYYRDRNRILFASEIKAIRASGYYADQINWSTASRYLLSGALNDSPATFYEGIEEVPSGTLFELSLSGKWDERRYWDIAGGLRNEDGLADPISTYRALFQDAVRLRMRSDVPVGVCLSGGLDSTGIICEMAAFKKSLSIANRSPLQAFCYMAEEFDESKYISDTLKQTGAELNRVDMKHIDLWKSLADVLKLHDEPVHSLNAVIGFEMMRLAASKGIKVILNGQGSDETAAGYSSHFLDYWTFLLMRGRIEKAWREIKGYAASNKMSCGILSKQATLRAIATLLARWPLYRLLKPRVSGPFQDLFEKDFICSYRCPQGIPPAQSLTEVLHQSVQTNPLPLYLRVEDRNSMGNSVEVRLPFLDYRLVSFLFTLPDEHKLRGSLNKFIQRQAFEGIIPPAVLARQDKMGFPVPTKKWIANLYEPMADLFSSRACRERGIYNMQAIRHGLEQHRHGKCDASSPLLIISQFELWNANVLAGSK